MNIIFNLLDTLTVSSVAGGATFPFFLDDLGDDGCADDGGDTCSVAADGRGALIAGVISSTATIASAVYVMTAHFTCILLGIQDSSIIIIIYLQK